MTTNNEHRKAFYDLFNQKKKNVSALNSPIMDEESWNLIKRYRKAFQLRASDPNTWRTKYVGSEGTNIYAIVKKYEALTIGEQDILVHAMKDKSKTAIIGQNDSTLVNGQITVICPLTRGWHLFFLRKKLSLDWRMNSAIAGPMLRCNVFNIHYFICI
jgi:hypothetical protein